MSRELVPVGDEYHLADPATGETVALSEAGDDLLADALDHLDEAKRLIDVATDLAHQAREKRTPA